MIAPTTNPAGLPAPVITLVHTEDDESLGWHLDGYSVVAQKQVVINDDVYTCVRIEWTYETTDLNSGDTETTTTSKTGATWEYSSTDDISDAVFDRSATALIRWKRVTTAIVAVYEVRTHTYLPLYYGALPLYDSKSNLIMYDA